MEALIVMRLAEERVLFGMIGLCGLAVGEIDEVARFAVRYAAAFFGERVVDEVGHAATCDDLVLVFVEAHAVLAREKVKVKQDGPRDVHYVARVFARGGLCGM